MRPNWCPRGAKYSRECQAWTHSEHLYAPRQSQVAIGATLNIFLSRVNMRDLSNWPTLIPQRIQEASQNNILRLEVQKSPHSGQAML